MVRVEFAYPYEVEGKAYRPDEAAEIEDGTAATLVAHGLARMAKSGGQPEPEPELALESLTVPQLQELAAASAVDLTDITRKTDIIAAIRAATTKEA